MQEKESFVTDHACNRIRKRIGVSKKAIRSISNRALERGLAHSQLTGNLKRYVNFLYLKKKTANNIKVYSEKIFIFKGTTLITVFPLPTDLKKIANSLIRKNS